MTDNDPPTVVQVVPRFKDNLGVCGCGCQIEGVLRVKPWRDGVRCVRTCTCNRCRGRRNRSKGQRGQAKASTALGMPRSTIRVGHEEFSGGTVRWEHKDGAQAKPIITRFRLSEAQSEAARATGDHRPFVATFGHDGRLLAVVDVNDLPEVVAALATQLGMNA